MSTITEYFSSYASLSSKIYWMLYEGAPHIVWWFIKPLSETTDNPIITETIGEMSPLEITFGVGIIIALTMGLINMIKGMTPL